MTSKKTIADTPDERLLDELLKDIDGLTDDELMQELAEDGVDVNARAEEVRSVVTDALRTFDSRRIADARRAAQTARAQPAVSNIIKFPLQRKRDILASVQTAANDWMPITMAARNGGPYELSEAEVDGLLQDLVRLGVIDDEGHIV